MKDTIRKIIIAISIVLPVLAAQYSIVEIQVEPGQARETISSLNLDPVNEGREGIIQVVADTSDLDRIMQAGIQINSVRNISARNIPYYQSYDEVVSQLNLYHTDFPQLTEVIEIGVSSEEQVPIYAIKISDNAALREDETVVWIDGVHHAREPMSMMTCMVIIDYLLNSYGSDTVATQLVDNLETWVVPILNTEGYKYFIDSTSASPWWRKNKRDNNGNGQFEFYGDGVDINRNYDSDWENSTAGSINPAFQTYKGVAPFSENAAAAKRDLVLSLRPITAISYHSYGELIYFKNGINGHYVAETPLITLFTQQMATLIPRLDGNGSYSMANTFNEAPMSYYWMYEKAGVFEMLVELGEVFVPEFSVAQQVAGDNLPSAIFLLERSMVGPGIRGHVRSAYDSSAVASEVKIIEYYDPGMAPRRNEPVHGRFNRLTNAGKFNVATNVAGYAPDTINVTVTDNGWADAEFFLDPLSLFTLDGVAVDDSGNGAGNGDSILSPGETVVLGITISNHGIQLSGEVTIALAADDPYITLIDSTIVAAPVDAGSTREIVAAFTFTLAADSPFDRDIRFNFQISDTIGVASSHNKDLAVVQGAVVAAVPEIVPGELILYANYPNPFNPVTTISYNLPAATPVSLAVYDISGRNVRSLFRGKQGAGRHSIEWDGRENSGSPAGTGIYFYRLRAGETTRSGKMLLLK